MYSISIFLFYILLIWGVYAPPHRLPTGLVPEFTQSCCLTVLLTVNPVTAGTMTRQY